MGQENKEQKLSWDDIPTASDSTSTGEEQKLSWDDIDTDEAAEDSPSTPVIEAKEDDKSSKKKEETTSSSESPSLDSVSTSQSEGTEEAEEVLPQPEIPSFSTLEEERDFYKKRVEDNKAKYQPELDASMSALDAPTGAPQDIPGLGADLQYPEFQALPTEDRAGFERGLVMQAEGDIFAEDIEKIAKLEADIQKREDILSNVNNYTSDQIDFDRRKAVKGFDEDDPIRVEFEFNDRLEKLTNGKEPGSPLQRAAFGDTMLTPEYAKKINAASTEEEKAALSAEIKADLDALAKVDNIPGWYTASFDEKSLDDQAKLLIGLNSIHSQAESIRSERTKYLNENLFAEVNEDIDNINQKFRDGEITQQEAQDAIKAKEDLKANYFNPDGAEVAKSVAGEAGSDQQTIYKDFILKINEDERFQKLGPKEKFDVFFLAMSRDAQSKKSAAGIDDSLSNHFSTRLRDHFNTKDIMGLPIPDNFLSLSDEEIEAFRAEKNVRDLETIFYNNRLTNKLDRDNFFQAFWGSMGESLFPETSKLSKVNRTRTSVQQGVLSSLSDLGVEDKSINKEAVEALQEESTPRALMGKDFSLFDPTSYGEFDFDGEKAGALVGNTGAIVLTLAESALITKGAGALGGATKLGSLAKGSKLNTLLRNSKASMYKTMRSSPRLTKYLKPAFKEGVKFEVAGDIFENQEEELNFLSGSLGALGGALTKEAINKLSKTGFLQPVLDRYESFFGPKAKAAVEIAKSAFSRGAGEMQEETIQELVNTWQSTPDGKSFLDELRAKFPNMSSIEEFYISSFMMGSVMGFKGAVNDGIKKYKDTLAADGGSSPALDQVMAEAATDMEIARKQAESEMTEEELADMADIEAAANEDFGFEAEQQEEATGQQESGSDTDIEEDVSEPETEPVVPGTSAEIDKESEEEFPSTEEPELSSLEGKDDATTDTASTDVEQAEGAKTKEETVGADTTDTEEDLDTPDVIEEISENDKLTNRLLSRVDDYNKAKGKNKKSEIGQRVQAMASNLGLTVSEENGKMKILNDKGKQVKTKSDKTRFKSQPKSDIDAVSKAIDSGLLEDVGDVQYDIPGITTGQVLQGIRDIKAGKTNTEGAKALTIAFRNALKQGGFGVTQKMNNSTKGSSEFISTSDFSSQLDSESDQVLADEAAREVPVDVRDAIMAAEAETESLSEEEAAAIDSADIESDSVTSMTDEQVEKALSDMQEALGATDEELAQMAEILKQNKNKTDAEKEQREGVSSTETTSKSTESSQQDSEQLKTGDVSQDEGQDLTARKRNRQFLKRMIKEGKFNKPVTNLLKELNGDYVQSFNKLQAKEAAQIVQEFAKEGRLDDLFNEISKKSKDTDFDGGVTAMIAIQLAKVAEANGMNELSAEINEWIDDIARQKGRFIQALADRGFTNAVEALVTYRWENKKKKKLSDKDKEGNTNAENIDKGNKGMNSKSDNVGDDIADDIDLDKAVTRSKKRKAAESIKNKEKKSNKISKKLKEKAAKEKQKRKDILSGVKRSDIIGTATMSGLSSKGIEIGAALAASHVREGLYKTAALVAKLKEVFEKEFEYNLTDADVQAILQSEADKNGITVEDVMAIEEQNATSQKLAQRVLGVFSDSSKKKEAELLDIILKELTAKAKEKLPKRKNKESKASYSARVIMALGNLDVSSDVWDSAQGMVEAKINDMVEDGEISEAEADVLKSKLDNYFEDYVGQPFSDGVLDKAISEQMKSVGVKAKDVLSNPDLMDSIVEYVQRKLTDKYSSSSAQDVRKAIGENIKNRVEKEYFSSVDNFAESVINKVTESKPQVKDAFDLMVQELSRKLNDTIPNKKQVNSKDYIASLVEQLKIKDGARAYWDHAQRTVKDSLKSKVVNKEMTPAEMADVLSKLDDYFQDFIGKPFSGSTLKNAVSQQLKSMDVQIKDIIRKHWSVKEAYGNSLAEKFVAEAGLDTKTAMELQEEVLREYKNRIKVSAEKALARSLGVSKLRMTKRVKSTLEKMMEAYNLGALDTDMYTDLFSEHFGFVSLNPEDKARISAFSNNMNLFEEGSEAYLRTANDFKTYLKSLERSSYKLEFGIQLSSEMFFRSILSGPTTVARGLFGAIYTSASEALVEMIKNPKLAFASTQGISSLYRGFKRGTKEFASIMKDEYIPYNAGLEQRVGYIQNIMNTPMSKLSKGGKILQIKHFVPTMVFRTLLASDALMRYTVREWFSTVKAYNDALTQPMEPRSKEFWKYINDQLILNDADKKLAEEQARQEFEDIKAKGGDMKNFNVKRRAQEILDKKRTDSVNEFAEYKADKALLSNKPEGVIGYIYSGAVRASADIVFFNRLVPFLKIPSNALDTWIDYSPWGIIRGIKGKGTALALIADQRTKDKFNAGRQNMLNNPGQRMDYFIKGAIGTTMLAGMAASAMANFDDDEEDKWFDISYKGYGTIKDNQGLINEGWEEMSFRLKIPGLGWSGWVDYRDTPMAMMFAAIGSANDSKRYNKDDVNSKELSLGDIATVGTAHSMLFLQEQNYMKSLVSLSNMFNRESTVTSNVANFTGDFFVKNVKATLVENSYLQAFQSYQSFSGIPRKNPVRYTDNFMKAIHERLVMDMPFFNDAVDDTMIDQFGNEIVRNLNQNPGLAVIPDYLVDVTESALSPDKDTYSYGWDVSNYHKVAPGFGTIKSFNDVELDYEDQRKVVKYVAEGLEEYSEMNYDYLMGLTKSEYSDQISKEKSRLKNMYKYEFLYDDPKFNISN